MTADAAQCRAVTGSAPPLGGDAAQCRAVTGSAPPHARGGAEQGRYLTDENARSQVVV